MRTLESCELVSPVGRLGLAAEAGALVGVTFDGLPSLRRWAKRAFGPFEEVAASDPAGAASALRRFFAGDLSALSTIPVRLHGTDFQRRVWTMLRHIPVGETWSYRALARAIGDERATRAVGAANGQNPIPIVVPCHRVIGSDGRLTGFGGGLPCKAWLLRHEGALQPELLLS
jgi:methylated-DNA-[protein]-cysteine S-methyltransferase